MNIDDIQNPTKKEQNKRLNTNQMNSRLTSDPEEYGLRLGQFAEKYNRHTLYPGQGEAEESAHIRLGLIHGKAPMTSRGGGVGLAMGNIVDVESEILGHTRDNTRCPSGKQLPKEGAIEEGGSGAIQQRPSRRGTAPLLVNATISQRTERDFTVRRSFLMPKGPAAPEYDWRLN